MERKPSAIASTGDNMSHQSGPGQSSKSSRRRPHTAREWAAIRPRLKYLYIDMNMTLQNIMRILQEEQGFDATEQMYKKRLRAWNISKNVKAYEKEKAIITYLHSSRNATGPGVRYDKLVRYAKSHTNRHAPSDQTLQRFIKDRTRSTGEEYTRRPSFIALLNADSPSRSGYNFEILPRSPSPPGALGRLDLFMRAMRCIIAKERQEWLYGQKESPDIILTALRNGVTLWKKDEFEAARLEFGRASQMVNQDLQGSVYVSRIAYCISSSVWLPKRDVVFQKFADYMAKAANEIVGPDCPLTVVLQHLPNEYSLDAHLAMWACALDDYEISEQNVDHWWGMAKRRWRWCMSIGRSDLAEHYCSFALSEVRRIGKSTSTMEAEAETDIATASALLTSTEISG